MIQSFLAKEITQAAKEIRGSVCSKHAVQLNRPKSPTRLRDRAAVFGTKGSADLPTSRFATIAGLFVAEDLLDDRLEAVGVAVQEYDRSVVSGEETRESP